jgi:hypothetical protein
MSDIFEFNNLAPAFDQLRAHGIALQKQGVALVRIAESGIANIAPLDNLVTTCLGISDAQPQRGCAARPRQCATLTRQNILPETVRPETGGLPGNQHKAIRKQSTQSNLPEVCPFALYAFCMLSEHRFAKVGKSQKAHTSAHLKFAMIAFCEGNTPSKQAF